jgi:uncharacterized membrane protein YbaN (DUF454 family)
MTDGVRVPDLIGEPHGEHSMMRRVLWGLGAAICFVLGIVGWLIPIMTGIPFYMLGIVLLSKAVPPFGRWINRKERTWKLKWRLLLRPALRKQVLAQRRE